MAPMISPRYPSSGEDMAIAPANAVDIGPIKAKDDPRNTGLLLFVKRMYTRVPIPAPNKAAPVLIPLPTMTGTTSVAVMIASSCCREKMISCPALGLS